MQKLHSYFSIQVEWKKRCLALFSSLTMLGMIFEYQALFAEGCVWWYDAGWGEAREGHISLTYCRDNERGSNTGCILFPQWNESYGFGSWCMFFPTICYHLWLYIIVDNWIYIPWKAMHTSKLVMVCKRWHEKISDPMMIFFADHYYQFSKYNNEKCFYLHQVALYNYLISTCGKCNNSDQAILVLQLRLRSFLLCARFGILKNSEM